MFYSCKDACNYHGNLYIIKPIVRPKKINNLVLRPARMSFNNAHYPFLSSNE